MRFRADHLISSLTRDDKLRMRDKRNPHPELVEG